MVEQNANQQEATANVPRVLAGLQSGRIVHYVMKDGSHRPLLVIANFDNSVCGFLFLKSGDHDNLPAEARRILPARPVRRRRSPASRFDDALGVGTWHWPPREAAPVAAAVDPEALATQIQGVAGALFEAGTQRAHPHGEREVRCDGGVTSRTSSPNTTCTSRS
jgi:hypothetical protein